MRFLCALILLFPLSALGQESWSGFRGPGARGLVPDNPTLPEVWSATENVAWKIDVPGLGWSCPVVWGDKVFLTTVIKEGPLEEIQPGLYFGGNRDVPEDVHEWKVLCYDAKTGAAVWEDTVHKSAPPGARHNKNTFASETVVTDGERLYAYFGNVGMFCYDLDGDCVWERRWDPVETRYGWGSAASPALHEDSIVLVNDNDEQSFLEILDKRTGKTLKRVDREEGSNWSTPFVWKNDLRTEIITPGTDKTRSYDLEGNLLWSLEGASSITVATPFTAHGLLYVSSGYILDKHKPLYAIRPGASGDISLAKGETANEFIAWSYPKAAPYIPSTLVYGDYLYVLYDQGLLACFDAKTGEEVYEKERLRIGFDVTASPWAYNGKIFCLGEGGETVVVKAGPEFEILGENALDEFCMATPAIAHESLFIRTAASLYRIQNGQ